MSTAQVESVLVEHKSVAESAVVAAPHKVKGECLYCFVTPKDGCRVRSIDHSHKVLKNFLVLNFEEKKCLSCQSIIFIFLD